MPGAGARKLSSGATALVSLPVGSITVFDPCASELI